MLVDPFRFELAFDERALDDAHVVDVRAFACRDDPRHAIVLEIESGVVVTGIAGLHASARNQRLIERTPSRLAVVVRTMAARQESEALDNREFLRAGIGRALFEPAERASARAAEHDPPLPRLAQHDVDPL